MEGQTEFWAIVYKVQTLAGDNGIRVTLDLPETAIVEMAELAAYKVNGVVLDVTCKPRRENESDTAISRTTAKRRDKSSGSGVQ